MTRSEAYCVAGWTLTVAASVVILYLFVGCAPLPEPDSTKAGFCMGEIKRIAASSGSCQIAVARLADLGEQNARCAEILGDAGLHLVCHDGGAK